MAEKTDKEWENELSPERFLDKWQKYVDQGKEAGCKEIEISNEAMDRLISMARKSLLTDEEQNIFNEGFEEGLERMQTSVKRVASAETTNLKAMVERYEKALRRIEACTYPAEHVSKLATEALEE